MGIYRRREYNLQYNKTESSTVVVTNSNKDIHMYKDGRRVATIFYRPQIPKEVPRDSIWFNKLIDSN